MTDKKKMRPLARDILEGLNSALAHAKGKPTPGIVEHVVLAPDVKAIREALGLSQSEFPKPTTFRFLLSKDGSRTAAIPMQQRRRIFGRLPCFRRKRAAHRPPRLKQLQNNAATTSVPASSPW
jgi:hypothetical protein